MSHFLFVPLRSLFLCYPGEALEGPISTGVCKNSTMLIKITTYKYEKLLCYIYIYIIHLTGTVCLGDGDGDGHSLLEAEDRP